MVLRWSGSHGYPPGQPHTADVFRSTDSGFTWGYRGGVLNEYPYDDMGLDLASSPSGILYCILWDRDHLAMVFRSSDKGLSWDTAGIVRNDYSHWDAASAALACPSDDSIYALLWSRDVTDGCEMYVSHDSGSTWILVSHFAGGLAGQDKDIGFVIDVTKSFYALIWNAFDYPKVYKSTDGINWPELAIVDSIEGSDAYCGASLVSAGMDTLVAGFWSGPAQNSLPLLSYYSTDGGMSWEFGDTVVYAVVDDGAFSFASDMGGNIYAVAWTNYLRASCYHSLDLGKSWAYRGEIFPTLPYAWTAGICITTYTTTQGVVGKESSAERRCRINIYRNRVVVTGVVDAVEIYSVTGSRIAVVRPVDQVGEFRASFSGTYFLNIGREKYKVVLLK